MHGITLFPAWLHLIVRAVQNDAAQARYNGNILIRG